MAEIPTADTQECVPRKRHMEIKALEWLKPTQAGKTLTIKSENRSSLKRQSIAALPLSPREEASRMLRREQLFLSAHSSLKRP